MQRTLIVLALIFLFLGTTGLVAQTSVSPASFAVTLYAGSTTTKTLTITNSGAAVSYSTSIAISSGGLWLARDPKSGTLPANGALPMTLTFDARAAQIGTHSGTVTITPSGRTPLVVPLTLVVKGISVTVSPYMVSHNLTTAETGTQAIVVSSPDTLAVAASASVPWVTFDKATAPVAPGAPATFIATLKPVGVTPGLYEVKVAINPADSSLAAPTQYSTLNVAVFSPDKFVPTPSAAAFTASKGASTASPSPLSLVLRNTGAAATYQVSYLPAWLKLNKTTGTVAADGTDTLLLTANPTGLASGTYSDIISISSNGRRPCNVPVSITVGAASDVTVSPGAMAFNGIAGQAVATPASATATITNTGAAATYNVVASAAWLKVSKSSGSLAADGTDSFTVSASAAGETAGTKTGTITITAAGKPTRTVGVTFSVAEATDLTVSPGAVALTGTAGSTSSTAGSTVTVTNKGSASPYTLSKNAAWIVLSKSGGSLAADGTDTFAISADAAALVAGSYNGTVTISASGRPTRTVAVGLTVSVPDDLTAAPSSLSFSGVANSATAPAAQTVTLTNQGAAVAYAVASNAAWLTVNKSSGTLAANGTDALSVVANPSTLAAGSYNAALTITAPGRPTRVVAVSFAVTAASDLTLSVSKLTFSGVAGQSFSGPATSSVKVTNKGEAVAYSLAASASWVVLSKAAGSLAANGADSFTVSANPASLAAGAYSATITASAPGRPARLITVSFTVAASEDMKLSLSAVKLTGLAGQAICTPATASVRIYNTGGQITYSASSNAAWLKLATTTGIVLQNSNALAYFNADATALPAGTYTGTLSFTAPSRPKRDLIVTLTVTDPTGTEDMTISPASLVSSMALKTVSPKLTVTVTNSGAQAAYTLTKNATWLIPSKTAGIMPANGSDSLTVSFSLTGLKAGIYSDSVIFQAASRPSRTLAVQLTVTDPAASVSRLSAFPASLEFVLDGTSAPEAQKLEFLTEDGQPVEVRIEEVAGETLSLSGVQSAGASGPVLVSTRTRVADGERLASLVAIPTDSAYEPLEVPVTTRPGARGELSAAAVMDGGGYETSIVLENRGTTEAKARIDLFEADGASAGRPWGLLLDGYDAAQGLTVPAAGRVVVTSRGLQSAVVTGWVRVRTDEAVRGQVLITQKGPDGEPRQYAQIPLNLDSRQRIFLPNAGDSSWPAPLSIANLSPLEPAEISAVLRNGSGEIVAGPVRLTLPELGQLTLHPAELFETLPEGRSALELSARGGRISGSLIRFTPAEKRE